MKKPLLLKIAAGAVLLGLFGFLFIGSIADTRAEAYTVDRAHLQSWRLVLEPASGPNDPLLVLQPTTELAGGLFKQIFSRSMESLNSPAAPSIPIILRSEFDKGIGDQFTPQSLLAAAKAAGLESAAPSPRCLVHRRISEPGGVRQAFLVFFDAPAIAEFRRRVGVEPDALSPIMFVAGAGGELNGWLPQRIDPAADCLAAVEIVG